MRMTGQGVGRAMAAGIGLPCLALLIALGAGCRSDSPSRVEAPPSVFEKPPVESQIDARFTVPAGTLDTWNAIGQIVVAVDGVTYETRAQMLGLYAVQFRGERFLILTRGLVVDEERRDLATRVSAAYLDGRPNESAAAVELLQILRRRLPAELERIANLEKK